MMESNLIISLLLIMMNNSLSLGISHEKKFESLYIVDVSSEDLSHFSLKLDSFLNQVKNKYYNFLVVYGIAFLFTYIILIKFIYINKILFFLILAFISFISIYNIYNDYQLGIKSANNAINNFHLTMNSETRKILDQDDPKNLKFKTIYVGDEIKEYGLHAVLCEIPGKLPSDNANPQSYAHLFGGNCYNFFSQRRFYDKNDISYVGDKKAEEHKTIKSNNLNIFLNNF